MQGYHENLTIYSFLHVNAFYSWLQDNKWAKRYCYAKNNCNWVDTRHRINSRKFCRLKCPFKGQIPFTVNLQNIKFCLLLFCHDGTSIVNYFREKTIPSNIHSTVNTSAINWKNLKKRHKDLSHHPTKMLIFVRSNKAVHCFDQCHYRHTTLNIWENNFQEKVNCFF